MAVLQVPANVVLVYSDGKADLVCLFALKNVSTGDTIDLGPWLQVINRGAVLGITSFVEIAASWTGTQVTMPSGLSGDAGYLLVWGSGR